MTTPFTRLLLSSVLAISLWGCAASQQYADQPQVQATSAEHASTKAGAKFERDRQAILAMAGEYDVDFHFAETVAMQEGYELRDPYDSGATEFVKVLEDDGDHIVLQHILVLGDDHRVVKHWRQDWTYEDTRVIDFQGHKEWARRDLKPEQVQGQWTQAVWQVDDSPRYESLGKWRHTANQSVWTSEETWRPLPRREHSKRDDYDVMVATNRHVITPEGWVHEQDNYKLVLRDGRKEVLARERGLNRYTRIKDYDFTAGHDYWQRTHEFWAAVREGWEHTFDEQRRVELKAEIDDETLWQRLFALAEEDPNPAKVPAVLDAFIVD